ncbi:MAG: tRNA lysidine(34) synthetase TilS [Rhodopirellula sp.]|nr:tRNA lysidine(34) synthetase TilS [Rhodopirellula sp.]
MDSTSLVRAMAAIQDGGPGRLIVAHYNHRLRGDESNEDQRFVETLSRRLGLTCIVESNDEGETGRRGSDGLEAAARAARYRFLQEAAARVGARYVATAHTADDQAETILHRVLRGTGIAGLSGMARVRPLGPASLIRPLLGFRREELAAYLERLGQPYRVDPSNRDLQFTRNRIRHELLPQLAKDFNPTVVDALLRLGTLAGEVQQVVARWVEQLYVQAVREGAADELRIDPRALASSEPYLVRELLIFVWRERGWPEQAMGYRQWDCLAEMLRGVRTTEACAETPRKQVFPGGVVAEVRHAELCLSRPVTQRGLASLGRNQTD